jgi:hypothetical protein
MKPNQQFFLINAVHFTGSYSPQPPNPERQIGPILETALQRAPILHIRAGKLQSAVTRYRYFYETGSEYSLLLLNQQNS